MGRSMAPRILGGVCGGGTPVKFLLRLGATRDGEAIIFDVIL